LLWSNDGKTAPGSNDQNFGFRRPVADQPPVGGVAREPTLRPAPERSFVYDRGGRHSPATHHAGRSSKEVRIKDRATSS